MQHNDLMIMIYNTTQKYVLPSKKRKRNFYRLPSNRKPLKYLKYNDPNNFRKLFDHIKECTP